MSTLWCCPSSIASADQGVAHPPRCPEGWFWRGCRGVWLARTMHVSNITTSQTRSIAHNRIKHEVRCFVLRWRCTVSRTCKFTYWRTDQLGPLKIIQCSSSVQSLDQLGRRGDLTDDSAESLFQRFLHEAIVSSLGTSLSILHFLCRPRRGSPSKLSWRATCLNYASFSLLQLPQKVPVDPQESWACSAPSHWSCAPRNETQRSF